MNGPLEHHTTEEKLLISLCRLEFNEDQRIELGILMQGIKKWDHFIKLLNEHGIVALSWWNITTTENNKNIPPEYLNILHNGYLKSLARNTYLYDQFSKILELINGEHGKIVLLKGMALEKTLYGNRGLRQMTDIDILVEPEAVLDLRKKLMQNGFKSEPFKSPLFKYLIPDLNTHIPRLTKEDCYVEIHYKLFDQTDNTLTEKLLELSTSVKIKENSAFIPPPQLFFLYLISHLEYHKNSGDSQLRMYADLGILLSSNYDEIIDKQLLNYGIEAGLERQLASALFLMTSFWKINFPYWFNDYIRKFDHSTESERFRLFLKQPGSNPGQRVSENYIHQISGIPGILRKIIFLIGFLCPSVSFMRKRYHSKGVIVFIYYPVRWVQTIFRGIGGVIK